MSTGNPQDGHSSSSSSASGMPGLVFSESGRSSAENGLNDATSSDDEGDDDEDDDDEATNSSPGIDVMPELIDHSSSGSGRNSRENLASDSTSSEEDNAEDTRTKLFSLISKKYATWQSYEKQRAARTIPQASLTKCHRLCAHMHAPRRAGGPWIQCANECREKENHNGRHNCYDQWHQGNRLFPPHRKGCQEKEKTSLTKCHRICAHMHSPCIEGGPWTQCTNQCQDKQHHNGRHNCYRDCHNQPFM